MATIKAGGDFTLVSDWANDLNGDTLIADAIGLVSGTITETAQIHFQNVTLSGHIVHLTTDTGQSFSEHADKATNALRYNTSNGAAVTSSHAAGDPVNIDIDMTITKLQFAKINHYNAFFHASGNLITFRQNIVLVNGVSVGADVLVFGTGSIIENCLVYKNGTNNVSQALASISGGSGVINNCTLANTGSGTVATGFTSAYGTSVAKNVAVFGCTTDAAGTLTGSINNATDSASGGFPATGRQNNLVGATEWVSVTDGSEDFRIKNATSVKLLDLGTSTGTPVTDIIGTSRTGSYDIGAWEHPAAGGGTSIIPLTNLRRFLGA